MTKRHSPSGSREYSIKEKIIRAAAIVGLGASALAAVLSGCSGENGAAQRDQEITSSTSVDDADAEESTGETEQPQEYEDEEYEKPDNRRDYNDVILDWYAQDKETTQRIGESDADEDLERRAQVIAALYIKHAEEEESRRILQSDNNNLNIGDYGQEYSDNPMFGTNVLTCDNNGLDIILSSQYLFPGIAGFEAYNNGKSYEEVNDIVHDTFNLLKGHIKPIVNPESLGFERAHFFAVSQPDKDPTQPATRTIRLTDKDVEAIDFLDRVYKPPVSEQYQSFWVMVVPEGDNPQNIALIQQVTAVPLSDAEGQIPDFDGNSWSMEFADPGTPVSLGHPKSEVIIPVVRMGYIISRDELPERLR